MWLGAGAKATRHLAAYGAEVIRIEWKEKLDFIRLMSPQPLPGDQAVAAAPRSRVSDPEAAPSWNRGMSFNNINPGKLGISLNMHHPRGKELFRRLLANADVVLENFTATTLERWGLGYEQLRAVKPDIIYVQCPGWGYRGPYREYRSYGPTAAAISGLADMVGLPDRQPCGWTFSYMDVITPWNIAIATIAALRYRRRTGKGQWIDLSQTGPAHMLTGTAILDHAVHGRTYRRTGNRSPYVVAAPHGAYPCAGEDRWIAIACSSEDDWKALLEVLGWPAWAGRSQFGTLERRYRHQDELDRELGGSTSAWERYALMGALQEAGVAAGVCQTLADRYDIDPQHRARGEYVMVPHREVGEYPIENVVGRWSRTQPHTGGAFGRGAPCYGQDNERVYAETLGLSPREISELEREGVI